jgi:competence protein ComEA
MTAEKSGMDVIQRFLWQPFRDSYMKHIEKWIIAFVFCLTAGFAHAEAIDVNTASAAEIAKALNGIGLNKAEAIVKDRETNGPFKSVDDLVRVKGIGPATLTKNKDLIIVK